MRTLVLLALLATSPAHAIMVQFTQTGILDDEAGTAITLTAFAHGDGVLSSIFAPYDFNPTYINPDFTLAVFDVRLTIGEELYTEADGTFSLIGDLGGPGGYDAAWWFKFGAWTLGVSDGSLYDAITSAEAAAWAYPEVEALLASDFRQRATSMQDPTGTRTRFVFASGDFVVNEVPEPPTILLFGTALLGFAFRARRQAA
jgi:hypothetical protein